MDAFLVAPVTPRDAPALALLMKREGTPCFCRYWHFVGTNKEWEARCALEPEKSERELSDAIDVGGDEGRGLIAKANDVVVGWMKLTWRRALPKLMARVPYRDLDLDAARVLSIGCFVVDPTMRRRGVARALVKGAIDLAPSWGARWLEAYPRRSDHALHDGEVWTGPERLFVELGFTVARDATQYPVLRLDLASRGAIGEARVDGA
jgi:GNAT superfamily N-acetyltransferase